MIDISDVPSPYSFKNRLGRVLWGVVYALLFRPSPKVLHGYRRFLLRLFGAKVGKGAHPYPSCRIWAPWNLTLGDHSTLAGKVDCYCAAPIRIGAHVTVSQYSFLCAATHDVHDLHMKLITAPITIEDYVWVCADVFVAPGVTLGEGAVMGARASVFSNMPAWQICIGSPARPARARTISKDEKDEGASKGAVPSQLH